MEIKERPVTLMARCCHCGKAIKYRTITYEQYDDEGNLVRMWDKLSSRDTNYKCIDCQNQDWKEQLERTI